MGTVGFDFKTHSRNSLKKIFFLLLPVAVNVLLYCVLPAQSQTSEENFQNPRFVEFQKEMIDCLARDYDSIPDSELETTGLSHRIMSYIESHGDCNNKAWSDRVQQMCLEIMIATPHLFKSEDDIVAYRKAVDAAGANPRSVVVVQAIFYKDPSRCDAIAKEENKLSHFRCRALSSAKGVGECLENFDSGDILRDACVNEYAIFTAVQTKDVSKCSGITEDLEKLICEALTTNSQITVDNMKHSYVEHHCLMQHTVKLAVAGVLDPEGFRSASDYCDTIIDPVAYTKCRELIYMMGTPSLDGDFDPSALCDKIPYDDEVDYGSRCKEAVAEAKALLQNRALSHE